MADDGLAAKRHLHPLDRDLLLALAAVLVECRHLLRMEAHQPLCPGKIGIAPLENWLGSIARRRHSIAA